MTSTWWCHVMFLVPKPSGNPGYVLTALIITMTIIMIIGIVTIIILGIIITINVNIIIVIIVGIINIIMTNCEFYFAG